MHDYFGQFKSMIDHYELLIREFKMFFESPECMSCYANSDSWVLDESFVDRWNKYIVPGILRMFGVNTLPHKLRSDPLYLPQFNTYRTKEFVEKTIDSGELGIQGN